jgi:glucokinase
MTVASKYSTGKEAKYAVLFDLGGTNIRVATATIESLKFQMNTVYSQKLGEDKSEQAVKDIIREAYHHVLREAGMSQAVPPTCLVMAQPGRVHEGDGTISGLANFPWTQPFPMQSVLRDMSGCERIVILDDCDAALYGEVKAESSPLPSENATALMLMIGTGIGSALFIDNHLYKGSRRLIEGGHMILYPDGLACPCGQRGCLEMYSSGTAIGRRGQSLNLPPSGPSDSDSASASDSDPPGATTTTTTATTTTTTTTAEDVVLQAQWGHAASAGILHRAARDLAAGLVSMCRLYDPRVVILGGGVGAILFEEVKREFELLSWRLHDDARDIIITLASCSEAGLSGCMAIATELMNCN